MQRTLVIALAVVAAALGGCATSLETRTGAPPADGLASPATSPAPSPANVFFPPPGPYDHGTGGP